MISIVIGKAYQTMRSNMHEQSKTVE